MKDQLVLPKVKGLLDEQQFAVKLEEMIAKQLEERKLCGVVGNGNNSNGGRANNSSNGQLQQQNGSNNRQGANSNSTSGNNNLNNNMRRNQQQQNQGQKNIPSNMNNVVDISDDSPT